MNFTLEPHTLDLADALDPALDLVPSLDNSFVHSSLKIHFTGKALLCLTFLLPVSLLPGNKTDNLSNHVCVSLKPEAG